MRYPTPFSDNPSHREVKKGSPFYHPELDVLRFVAFLAVFIHHALPREASHYLGAGLSPIATQWLLTAKEAGAFGLDLFFALSSYLITDLLLREYANRGGFSISAFYVRRALRIWPLYFTFLAATIFVIPTILPRENFGAIYIASFALFVGNWVCAVQGLPFSVASPLWSISVEEQFYIGWPLLLRFFGIDRLKQLAIGMLALAVATRILLAVFSVEHPAVWCNTLARLDPIALGAILAFVLGGRMPQMKSVLRLALGGVAFASWLLVARYLTHDGVRSVFTYLLSALASVMLLVAVLQGNVRILNIPPFSWVVYLGRISYGLYVFHLFALALVTKLLFVPLLGIPLQFESRLIFAFLLTVAMAAASYRWLELPFLRLKKRFTHVPAHEPIREVVRTRPMTNQPDPVG
jgi:peptidoglycan/LPS O-acetylase OafA/YrhL